MKKKVFILATGGTVSAAGDGGGTTNYLDGKYMIQELVAGVKGLDQLADLEYEQVLNVLSDDISPRDWMYLSGRITDLAKRDDIAGFVITHGTNTMEETAYYLNLTVKTSKPVVLTGAMRPATANSADGPQNIYEAVTVAASDEAMGRGVMIVFADGIYSASTVQKTNAFKPEAFSGRDFGCIGYVQDSAVYFMQNPQRLHTIDTDFQPGPVDFANVGILYCHADPDVELLEWAGAHFDGIVLAGTGAGCFSEKWKRALSQITKDIPVVRSSKTGGGLVAFNHFDQEAGTIPAYLHSPVKARILLALALGQTKDREKIGNIFKEMY